MVNLGIQDKIFCSPEDIDPKKLQGAFYQYTTRPVLYGDPQLITLIIYSQNVPIEWQRVICAKELVHLCDRARHKTMTVDELDALLAVLLGDKKDEDYGLADFQSHKDKLALYEALPLLMPTIARNHEKSALDAGSKTLKEIAVDAALPIQIVDFIMDDEWEYLKNTLYNNCQ